MRYMCSNCFNELGNSKAVCDNCFSETKTVVSVDDSIADAVMQFNKNKLYTLFTCAGHTDPKQHKPYLYGYIVFTFENNKEARKFIKDNFDIVSIYGDADLSATKHIIDTKSNNCTYNVYDNYIIFRNRKTCLFIRNISEKYNIKTKNYIEYVTIMNKPKQYTSCVILRALNALGPTMDDANGDVPENTVNMINKMFREMLTTIAERVQNERK